jgi:hypothetical protein
MTDLAWLIEVLRARTSRRLIRACKRFERATQRCRGRRVTSIRRARFRLCGPPRTGVRQAELHKPSAQTGGLTVAPKLTEAAGRPVERLPTHRTAEQPISRTTPGGCVRVVGDGRPPRAGGSCVVASKEAHDRSIRTSVRSTQAAERLVDHRGGPGRWGAGRGHLKIERPEPSQRHGGSVAFPADRRMRQGDDTACWAASLTRSAAASVGTPSSSSPRLAR